MTALGPSTLGTACASGFFEALVRDNADMIAVLDLEGRFTYLSDAARRMFDVEPDEWVGRDAFELVHPDDLGLAAESMGSTLASGSGVREPLLLRLRHGDGTWRQVEILTNNLSGDPLVAGLVITARDMSERLTAENTASDARDLFEQAFDRAPIGMAIVENDGTLRRVNSMFAAMLCAEIPRLIGKNLVALAHPEDRALAMDRSFRILGGEDLPAVEVRFLRPDRSVAWARATGTTIRSEAGDPLYSIVQIEDITEQLLLRQELQWAATHDPLTGLQNRSGLESAYGCFLDEGEERASAFLLIDLDGFKPVNDEFGHAVGDRVLQIVADRLRSSLRSADLGARIGGDVFVAQVLDVDSAREAVGIGERVRRILAEPMTVGEHEVAVSGSVGVALLIHQVDLEQALMRSDRAAYEAKRAGGDRVSLVWTDAPAILS